MAREPGVDAIDLRLGDCLAGLQSLAPGSIDALVTDPPAGIGFMGKGWDSDKGGRAAWVAWMTSVMRECLRALKPGAHALVWALPRTSHWTATAIEDAGFEVRDVVTHHFGSGFPKALNVSKAIDAKAGHRRGTTPDTRNGPNTNPLSKGDKFSGGYVQDARPDEGPLTDAAKQWSGWGTALKPGSEHWICARKPLIGTVAANVQEHGTGALNIDACRIDGGTRDAGGALRLAGDRARDEYRTGTTLGPHAQTNAGRWPANVILSHSAACEDGPCADDCPVREMDEQSGILTSGARASGGNETGLGIRGNEFTKKASTYGASAGGASRFFYRAKPSTAEREAGLLRVPGARRANVHPTVKSIALMEYLVKLVTPPRGTVLDPFAGSGTTGIAAYRLGHRFVGWEQNADYHAIALARIEAARRAQLDLLSKGAA